MDKAAEPDPGLEHEHERQQAEHPDTQNRTAIQMTKAERREVTQQVRDLVNKLDERVTNQRIQELASKETSYLLSTKLPASYAQVDEALEAMKLSAELMEKILRILSDCFQGPVSASLPDRTSKATVEATSPDWKFSDNKVELGKACEKVLWSIACGYQALLASFKADPAPDPKDVSDIKDKMARTVSCSIARLIADQSNQRIAPYVRREFIDVFELHLHANKRGRKVALSTDFGIQAVRRIFSSSKDYRILESLLNVCWYCFYRNAENQVDAEVPKKIYTVELFGDRVADALVKKWQATEGKMSVIKKEIPHFIKILSESGTEQVQLFWIDRLALAEQPLIPSKDPKDSDGFFRVAINQRTITCPVLWPGSDIEEECTWELILSELTQVDVRPSQEEGMSIVTLHTSLPTFMQHGRYRKVRSGLDGTYSASLSMKQSGVERFRAVLASRYLPNLKNKLDILNPSSNMPAVRATSVVAITPGSQTKAVHAPPLSSPPAEALQDAHPGVAGLPNKMLPESIAVRNKQVADSIEEGDTSFEADVEMQVEQQLELKAQSPQPQVAKGAEQASSKPPSKNGGPKVPVVEIVNAGKKGGNGNGKQETTLPPTVDAASNPPQPLIDEHVHQQEPGNPEPLEQSVSRKRPVAVTDKPIEDDSDLSSVSGSSVDVVLTTDKRRLPAYQQKARKTQESSLQGKTGPSKDQNALTEASGIEDKKRKSPSYGLTSDLDEDLLQHALAEDARITTKKARTDQAPSDAAAKSAGQTEGSVRTSMQARQGKKVGEGAASSARATRKPASSEVEKESRGRAINKLPKKSDLDGKSKPTTRKQEPRPLKKKKQKVATSSDTETDYELPNITAPKDGPAKPRPKPRRKMAGKTTDGAAITTKPQAAKQTPPPREKIPRAAKNGKRVIEDSQSSLVEVVDDMQEERVKRKRGESVVSEKKPGSTTQVSRRPEQDRYERTESPPQGTRAGVHLRDTDRTGPPKQMDKEVVPPVALQMKGEKGSDVATKYEHSKVEQRVATRRHIQGSTISGFQRDVEASEVQSLLDNLLGPGHNERQSTQQMATPPITPPQLIKKTIKVEEDVLKQYTTLRDTDRVRGEEDSASVEYVAESVTDQAAPLDFHDFEMGIQRGSSPASGAFLSHTDFYPSAPPQAVVVQDESGVISSDEPEIVELKEEKGQTPDRAATPPRAAAEAEAGHEKGVTSVPISKEEHRGAKPEGLREEQAISEQDRLAEKVPKVRNQDAAPAFQKTFTGTAVEKQPRGKEKSSIRISDSTVPVKFDDEHPAPEEPTLQTAAIPARKLEQASHKGPEGPMQEQVLQPTRRTRARAAVDEPTTTEEPLRPAVKPIQEQRLPRSVMRDRADHRARSPLETRKQVRVATAPPREVFAQPGSAIDRFDESEIVDSGFAETPTDTILDILGQLNRIVLQDIRRKKTFFCEVKDGELARVAEVVSNGLNEATAMDVELVRGLKANNERLSVLHARYMEPLRAMKDAVVLETAKIASDRASAVELQEMYKTRLRSDLFGKFTALADLKKRKHRI